MQKKSPTSVTAAELRRRAEAQLRKRQKKRRSAVGDRKSAADDWRLLHELQVHQVELEMQKAELQEDRARREELLEKYMDLYDFVPVGYFSLNEQSRILEVNLAGAALLGVERARLVNRSLTRIVAPASQPSFLSFLEQIFSRSRKRLCEATLVKADGTALWATFHGASDNSARGARKSCRVAVLDITTRKQAEQALQAAQYELEQRVEERTAELQRNCVRLAHEIEVRKRAEEDLEKELHFETADRNLDEVRESSGQRGGPRDHGSPAPHLQVARPGDVVALAVVAREPKGLQADPPLSARGRAVNS